MAGLIPGVAYATGNAFSTNATQRSDLDGHSVCGMAAATDGAWKAGPMVCLSLRSDFDKRSGLDKFSGIYTITAGVGISTPNYATATALEFGTTKTFSFPKPAGIITGIPPRF